MTADQTVSLGAFLRDSVACGVVVLDAQGRIAHMSPEAAALAGVPSPMPTVSPLLPEPLLEAATRVLETRQPLIQPEVELAGEEGRPRTLWVSGFPLTLGAGGPGVLLLLRSAGQDSQVESRLRHLERLARIGILSSGLAHELRNALVAVKTFTDALIEQGQDSEFVRTVRRELDRANAIAGHMLKYARPTHPLFAAVSVHQVLDRALSLVQPRFKETGARVTAVYGASPDWVSGDEALLEQVFLNLLMNAVDALESERRIAITTEAMPVDGASPPRLRVSIGDSGSGIAESHLGNLFKPFFTTKKHGTGLGLYVAKRIVDEHRGEIGVRSVPGGGTEFQVTLPMCSGS